MAYVDDVCQTFDISEFCTTVAAGVGEGRITSGLALRDATAAESALAALRGFHELAVRPEPPDVISAYLEYRPGATELFTALRAVSTHRLITSVALDCLTAIVRYSLEGSNPPKALEATRSVTKEIVKSRAVLIYDVFVNDQRTCAKKALNLLRLVAQCHPVLAKEIVNRFNLASETMAPALCSEVNSYCRVPFLDLLFVLIASGDYDVVNALATRSRAALVCCLRVIKQRTLKESNKDHPDVVSAMEQQKRREMRTGKGRKRKGEKPADMDDAILPSHIQKRELIAAINLLLAIQRHILWSPNHAVRRSAFLYPISEMLAAIAAADMPPLNLAPRQVTPEHEALREVASSIFVAVATDMRIGNIAEIVAALNKTALIDSKASVNFLLHVIEAQPKVCKLLLETGRYVSAKPALNSAWIGKSAIISACILRLSAATPCFARARFFEGCLQHSDALVRHTGVLIMFAFCKIVQADQNAAREPQKYLPAFRYVELLLKSEDADEDCQKLLVAYQELFDGNVEEIHTDLLKLSVETAGDELIFSYDAIQTGLKAHPQEAVDSILRKKYLSKLILRAVMAKDTRCSARLWYLCHEVLRCTDLFPPGTETEIDIYLAFLSATGSDVGECSVEFEKVVSMALLNPYGLFDELQNWVGSYNFGKEVTVLTCKTSILSVGAVFRLKKLRVSIEEANPGTVNTARTMGQMLFGALETIAACQKLMGVTRENSWLDSILIPLSSIWQDKAALSTSGKEAVVWSHYAQRMFSRAVLYPRTPYLHLIEALSACHLNLYIRNMDRTDHGNASVCFSTLWWAWDKFRGTRECKRLLSGFAQIALTAMRDSSTREFSGIATGLLLEGITGFQENTLNLLQEASAMRNRLSECDYAVFVCMTLHKRKSCKSPVKFAREAMEVLSHFEAKSEHGELVSVLQAVVIDAINLKLGYESSEIELLLRCALQILMRQTVGNDASLSVVFATSLLLKLVRHANERILLHSRRYLCSISEAVVPPLSSISLSCSNQLIVLLPYFPAMQRAVLAQITKWSATDFQRTIPQSLPLLSAVMKLGNYASLKNDKGYNEDKVCRGVLSAIRASGSFPDQGAEDTLLIEKTLAEVGRELLSSNIELKTVLNLLMQNDSKQHNSLSRNVLHLLSGVFLDGNEVVLTRQLGEKDVVEALTIILEWCNSCQIHPGSQTSSVALQVFCGIVKHLRRRRIGIYSVAKDASSLEKSLTAFCSNVLKGIHNTLGCCAPDLRGEGITPNSSDNKLGDACSIQLPLNCAKEVLLLDLVLDKAAKRTIISIGSHDGGLMYASLQRSGFMQEPHIGTSERAMTATISALLLACLSRLPRFGVDAEVATALIAVEGVFSLDLAGYTGTLTEEDVTIRTCMEAISQYFKVNGAREKLQLGERRARYFAPFSAQVLQMFNKKRLACTSDKIFRHPCKESSEGRVQGNAAQLADFPYEPVFVLRTFLRACGEALNNPSSAVLDIGKVAKDGVLDVALSGLASDSDDIRGLSYACLDIFSRAVGPTSGVVLESSAALYKDRKQLSFLLTLLMNSIPEPLAKVLPMFAVWFRISLKVALSPGDIANKAVTFFFLRAPTMDITDCLGVSYLLRCDVFGKELQSTRLLALEILRRGVHSVNDSIVLRRRKIIGTLLMLGGSSCGIDQKVQLEVLNTLEEIVARDRRTGISQELVLSHGVVQWLVAGACRDTKPDAPLKKRLSILRSLCSAIALQADSERFVTMFSRALASFSHMLSWKEDFTGKKPFVRLVVECGEAICRLAPRRRQLDLVDKSFLRRQDLISSDAADQGKQMEAMVAGIVARQNNFDIDVAFYEILLAVSVEKCSDIVGTNTPTCMGLLEHVHADEISMLHSFVAEGLLRVGRIEFKRRNFGSSLFLLMAKAMNMCPTVWLVIASIRILDMNGNLSAVLKRQTKRLPSAVPRELNLDADRRFRGVVDAVQMTIVDELMSAPSVESPHGMDQGDS